MHHSVSKALLPLFYSFALCFASCVRVESPAVAEDTHEVAPSTSQAGGPVPTERVDEELLNRTLIYTNGRLQIFRRTLNLLIDAELERRAAAGENISVYSASDEAVTAKIEQTIQEAAQQRPGLDFWKQLEQAGYTKERYQGEVRRTLLLDAMFTPDDPDAWPPITQEIFTEAGLWDNFVAKQLETMREQKAKGELQPIDAGFRNMMLRPAVIRWLLGSVPVLEPFDGLPAGIALQVGDTQVTTAELLAEIEPSLRPVQRARAEAFCLTERAVMEELAKQGVLLTEAETKAAIDEEKVEYAQSPISYEQVALEFLGFPTMEIYKRHHRLALSFKSTLPNPVPAETLQAHFDARSAFFGMAEADVEVILCSALDMSTGQWKEGDGFALASTRAQEAAAKLAEGADFGAILDEYSEFPDKVQGANPQMPTQNRGRFGPKMLNPLRDFLGDTEYLRFIEGFPLGDKIFFDAEVGAIYGPVRGPLGLYFYRVLGRGESTSEIDLATSERHQTMVAEDWKTFRFREFVDGVMGDRAEQ